MIYYAIAMLVISTIISYSMQPKQQSQKAASLEELDIPQAEEGTPQAVLFGDCWASDWVVLDVGNYSTKPIRG